jgi:NAD(P)-dependent dehydrogenase (short-subunit alcohol dehydrogenase family)
MDRDLHSNSAAVVTGAGRGIGRAIAKALVADGWKRLLLCDVDAAELDDCAATLSSQGADVATLCADVADLEFPLKLSASLAGTRIGALAHFAGLSPRMADVPRIFEVNLAATIRLVDAIEDQMAEGSAVVLAGSNSAYVSLPQEAVAAASRRDVANHLAELAHLAPLPEIAYPLSKVGVLALVKRKAKAFGLRGARIVSLSPGATDTRMVGLEGENAQLADILERSALRRVAAPDEIAAVAAFLCSAKASFMSGVDVLVDGGQVAGMAC